MSTCEWVYYAIFWLTLDCSSVRLEAERKDMKFTKKEENDANL